MLFAQETHRRVPTGEHSMSLSDVLGHEVLQSGLSTQSGLYLDCK